MGTSSALATARPHGALAAERETAAEAAGDADSGGWRLGGTTGGDDPLLACLVSLTELLERPASAQALVAGLPLPADGRLTPELAVRAAARAGLIAKFAKRPLAKIDDMALPAILLLADRGACILVRREADGTLVTLLPDSGQGATRLAAGELADRYAGWAMFARPELGREPRERDLAREEAGHWFWSTILRQWPIYGEVALAALLINLFALASPLFVMNVYDRVVPNNAVETLWILATGVLIVFAFDFLLKILRGYFVDSAGRIADIKLAGRIFGQVLGIRMASRPAC